MAISFCRTAVRASIGLSTAVDQVDRLLDAVRTITEIGPRLLYTAEDGRWRPRPDLTRSAVTLVEQRS